MKRWILVAAFIFVVAPSAFAEDSRTVGGADPTAAALERTRALVGEVIAASFPELRGVDVQVKTFRSNSDYFRSGISVWRFVFIRRMRYFVFVNPSAFQYQVPDDAVRAIIAHELAHVVTLNKGNRLRMAGLVKLTFGSRTARFERRTDLEVIARGYGEGLKNYRTWLYGHVDAATEANKRRDYFSPAEIDAVDAALKAMPALLALWSRKVPMSLGEVIAGAGH